MVAEALQNDKNRGRIGMERRETKRHTAAELPPFVWKKKRAAPP
jgi:hypothetical protein